jgi:L-fuculose-phosphate aldolase
MLDETTFSAFRDIGRDLFLRGLVSSHAGNLSVRTGTAIWITRTGAMLGRITRDDAIEVDPVGPDPIDSHASSELTVHRAIYGATGAGAVVHAHPPYATLLSMLQDELTPIDSEGYYVLGRVHVVDIGAVVAAGLPESARAVSEALKEHRIVLLKGHGSFARGDTLEHAYMPTSSLEASSFYLYHLLRRQGQGILQGIDS